ncbi:MAG TPA: peptidoglycan-binding protein [Solirubrobacterales bacterium]|nr:peptidoglycan-binding protein [Solirubrobacterales bacterium]
MLAAVAILLAVAGFSVGALEVTSLGGGSGNASHEDSSAGALATVTRRHLSSQQLVEGTLGYRGSSDILVPAGTAPSAMRRAEQSVRAAERSLGKATASLSADRAKLAEAQANVAAAREKESVDCAGDGAAESGGGDSSKGGGADPCATAAQALGTAEQTIPGASSKVTSDLEAVSSAERTLVGARHSLWRMRATGIFYDKGSVFTALPGAGRVIRRGQPLYEAAGQHVLLLYGPLIATRAFLAGMQPGRDVAELNANLQVLGYGHGLAGDTFTVATADAIRAFQSAHSMAPTGELLLGSVVFEPGSVRITSVTPQVGSTVQAGPVLGISSTRRQVTVELDASQQGTVGVGDKVKITLPSGKIVPGAVSKVGKVATEGESGPTVPLYITPHELQGAGALDEAPVQVQITTARVKSALVVPVTALLALAGGGYAVEVAGPRGHRLVAVETGLFDDAQGLVQVSGKGLKAGQRVVVPAT